MFSATAGTYVIVMSSPSEEAALRNSVVTATCPVNKPPLPRHHTPHHQTPRHHLTTIFRHIHIWALIVCSTDVNVLSWQHVLSTNHHRHVCDIYRFPLKIWGRLLQRLSHYISDMDIYWIFNRDLHIWRFTGYLIGTSMFLHDVNQMQPGTKQWPETGQRRIAPQSAVQENTVQ